MWFPQMGAAGSYGIAGFCLQRDALYAVVVCRSVRLSVCPVLYQSG